MAELDIEALKAKLEKAPASLPYLGGVLLELEEAEAIIAALEDRERLRAELERVNNERLALLGAALDYYEEIRRHHDAGLESHDG